MKIPPLLLLICGLFGCATPPPKHVASPPFDISNLVTPDQLEQARHRLRLLKADMTREQVFATLGLSDCYGRCLVEAGGPPGRFWVSYTLRSDHHLVLISELLPSRQIVLRSVTLDNARWDDPENLRDVAPFDRGP